MAAGNGIPASTVLPSKGSIHEHHRSPFTRVSASLAHRAASGWLEGLPRRPEAPKERLRAQVGRGG